MHSMFVHTSSGQMRGMLGGIFKGGVPDPTWAQSPTGGGFNGSPFLSVAPRR